MRKTFAKLLMEMAAKDDKLVVLIGDISHYLLKEFEEAYPDRFYNVGICEQSIISIAAGLAMEGFRPIVHTIAPFCVERAYEQIKVDMCYQNLDVTIVSVGGSFDYAHLGCTHHCYSDVAILRALPNMQVYSPGNSDEFKASFKRVWGNSSPKYFKLFAKQHTYKNDEDFKIIKNVNSKFVGNNKSVFVTGHMLDHIIKKIDDFNTVVYMSTYDTLSKENELKVANILRESTKGYVFVLEENLSIGGLGDAIFNIASENNISIKMRKLGIKKQFLEEYGSADQHREKLGLTYNNVCNILEDM